MRSQMRTLVTTHTGWLKSTRLRKRPYNRFPARSLPLISVREKEGICNLNFPPAGRNTTSICYGKRPLQPRVIYLELRDRHTRPSCQPSAATEGSTPAVKESIDNWYFSAAGTEVTFDKQNGLLRSVTSGGKAIPLNNGPVLISNQDIICKSVEYKQVEGNPQLIATYTSRNGKIQSTTFTWTMLLPAS